MEKTPSDPTVSRSQLAEVFGALQAEVATKKDMREMLAMLAKVEGTKRVTWHFHIIRDPHTDLATDMIATTEDLP